LEEVLFRGAIYTALRRAGSQAGALLSSSAIYAITHFFARPENPSIVEWHSGFQILGGMLAGFTDLATIFPGFLNLTLLGIILALAFRQTGALWVSIGLHAALVFWIKLYAAATNQVATGHSWFWGTEKLIDGWCCFLLLLGGVALFLRKQPGRA
jgi:membrane protease YdiL (CAAX protease family)